MLSVLFCAAFTAILVRSRRRRGSCIVKKSDAASDESVAQDGLASVVTVNGSVIDFAEFEQPINRTPFFTVAHEFCAPNATPMWVADMELATAPAVHRAIMRRATHPTFGYTIQPPRLWRAVARWLRRHWQWHVEPERFVFTPCLVSATVHALRAWTRKGDGVALVLPLFEPLHRLVSKEGRVVHSVPLIMPDIDGVMHAPVGATSAEQITARCSLDVDELRRVFEQAQPPVRMLIWCSPHNPTGKRWSHAEQVEVARVCKTYGVIILSDEIWAPLTLWGDTHEPMAAACEEVDHAAAVATLCSPAKAFNIAGVHCGYVVLPGARGPCMDGIPSTTGEAAVSPSHASLHASYMAVVEHAALHFGNVFSTTAMLAVYEDPTTDEWLVRLRLFLQRNIELVEGYLRTHCYPEILPVRPQATYLVWLQCKGLGLSAAPPRDGSPSDSELCRWFRLKAGIQLSDGHSFGGADWAQFQRMNVACPTKTLRASLLRLGRAVAELRAARVGQGIRGYKNWYKSGHTVA